MLGKKGRSETMVTENNTASTYGSGLLDVFSTPAMVALMENAAINSLDLPEGQTSVGTALDIKHVAATPIGMKVWAEAEVVEAEGRRLVYQITAYDDKEKIGEGRHERFIVQSEKFMVKANAKLD